MPLNKETEDCIAGWKQQFASYQNLDDVAMMFQKFDALYPIYNRLFNEISFRLRELQRDKDGATSHVVQYLTADALAASIEGNKETKNAEQQLRDFIRKHVYHFVLVGKQRDPSDEEDDKLLAKMESKDNKERMEGLLHLIYHVRCNRVHGQKHFSDRQLPLLRAVIPILYLVVTMTEDKLRV